MSSIINVNQIGSKNGTLTVENNVVLDLQNVNSFFEIPSGSNLQRPTTPTEGAIRWNTNEKNPEVYDGYTWRSFKKVNDYQQAITGSVTTLDTGNDISYPESGGSKWYNYESYENRATLIGDPVFNTNNRGYFDFNGSSHYAIFYNPTDKLYPINAITQECWFKTSNSTLPQNLIGLQYGISTNASYKLGISGTAWYGGVNINGTFQEISVPFTSFPMDDNTWYQLAHTFTGSSFNVNTTGDITNGSTTITNVTDVSDIAAGYTIVGTGIPDNTTVVSKTTNTITISNAATSTFSNISFRVTVPAGQRIYINGQVIAAQSITGVIDYNENNSEITIGTINKGPGTDTGKTDYLNGSLAVVRIYTRSLKEGQILTNYNTIKSRYGL